MRRHFTKRLGEDGDTPRGDQYRIAGRPHQLRRAAFIHDLRLWRDTGFQREARQKRFTKTVDRLYF